MVSTDRSKLVAVASLVPAVLLGLLLFWQWRSTACTFVEAAPGLRLCHQHLLGYQPETALIRVQSREGVWPWRRAVRGRGGPRLGLTTRLRPLTTSPRRELPRRSHGPNFPS